MSEKYVVSVKAVHANIFRQHVREIMKEDGFKERMMFGGTDIICICYFEKDDDIVSLTITKESMDQAKIELHSETLSTREVVLKGVAHMVHDLSAYFLEPVLPRDNIDDVKRTIQDTILARM